MSQQLLVVFFTFLVLLLMAGTFLYFYFRSLRHELNEQWETVLDSLRLRLDKIPNFLETVRGLTTGQDEKISELAALRSRCWPMNSAEKEKVLAELEISEKLRVLWELGRNFPELEKDTNFLALKSEFKEMNEEIEKAADSYNEEVRRYNRSARNIFFLPFAILFRFSGLPVFEFEP